MNSIYYFPFAAAFLFSVLISSFRSLLFLFSKNPEPLKTKLQKKRDRQKRKRKQNWLGGGSKMQYKYSYEKIKDKIAKPMIENEGKNRCCKNKVNPKRSSPINKRNPVYY